MDVLLRCEIPDVPGRLATVAGAIGQAHGDIQAVEVIQTADGMATDDLWIATDDLAAIVDRLEALDGCTVVHAGVSRGLPGDGTARLASGIDALMSGAMLPGDGLATVIGGLLHATTALVMPPEEVPTRKNRRTLKIAVSGGVLVLTREYRFLDSEVQKAHLVLSVCERAAAVAAGA